MKPLDKDLIRNLAESHELLVTLEENAIAGGAGAAVNEYLAELNLSTSVLNLGLPDSFIDHGKHEDMLTACGLDSEGVLNSIRQRLDSSLRGKDDGELVIPA